MTRFLPAAKRVQVDVIYAAVRYPDEVVDSFPLDVSAQLLRLSEWRAAYDHALRMSDWHGAIQEGISPWVAAFAEVVRRNRIPAGHYYAFLDAMAADARPRTYRDLDDLIEGYIYGSAVVVGYFLAWVYQASSPAAWRRALDASRNLGIALQLTNFLRDVTEDQRRGRVYLPQDLLLREGISVMDASDPSQSEQLSRVVRRVSGIAEAYYGLAECDLDAFAPDCRIAIRACIDVYRQLNRRIGASPNIRHRASVPAAEKFRALPASKFWRLPLAYFGAI